MEGESRAKVIENEGTGDRTATLLVCTDVNDLYIKRNPTDL
ncbi:hypothetical protein EMIT0210MI2_270002 [Priestia megaterium]